MPTDSRLFITIILS